MSAAATIERAATGELPAWACVGEKRRAHIGRVADLLDRWAAELGLDAAERVRWRAAGWLHDSLRDADAEVLRVGLQPELADLPARLLHGPAAARRLESEGVQDGELLEAIAYHTIGSASLRLLGRALYAADFLEPGRSHAPILLATLRARMPAELDAVVLEVAAARIRHLIGTRAELRPETLGFWNVLAREATA